MIAKHLYIIKRLLTDLIILIMKKINPIIKLIIIMLVFVITIIGILATNGYMPIFVAIVGVIAIYYLTYHWL